MGKGPVTYPAQASSAPPAKPPSWKLTASNGKNVQGLVVSGFANVPSAQALFLFCDWPDGQKPASGGAWLNELQSVAPITDANKKDADKKDNQAASLAFTYTGLQKMGLSADVLATFSQPFREGMYQEDRLRRLGDKVREKWQDTVIPGGPCWSGNVPQRKVDEVPKQPWERSLTDVGSPLEKAEEESKTDITVHALLVLYETSEQAALDWARRVEQKLLPCGVRVVHRLPLELLPDKGFGREHFGFVDGISQPIPYEEQEDPKAPLLVMSDGSPVTRDEWHGVPLGEILIGHTNAHHEKAPGPFVAADDARASGSGLVSSGAPEGLLNFGLNGSYLVVRELRQYVGAFWSSLEENAARIRAHDPGATHVTAEWLAERVIGRNIDGHLLCPDGPMKPDKYGCPENSFGFKMTDPDSFGCPAGSHMRRANPRDGLAKDMASATTLLNAANNHRILRRGRKFGKPPANRTVDDGAERGLLFMCLNTDIARQFEFVQQTWVLNSNFATLFDETDPLIGPKGGFTIQEQPLRRIVNVKTFIQLAGGDYFFLPSMPALRYLAKL